MKLQFIYSSLPFWRAEIERVVLFLGDVEFDNLRINREEFARAKKTGILDDDHYYPSIKYLAWLLTVSQSRKQVEQQGFAENLQGNTRKLMT